MKTHATRSQRRSLLQPVTGSTACRSSHPRHLVATGRALLLWISLLLCISNAHASLTHTFTSASAPPPVSAASYTASGAATLTLGFAPTPGTSLTVVENTGVPFISGGFSNLTHGDVIALTFASNSYNFVANYYGGTGNDLVLEWATTKPVCWGWNAYGQLGNNSLTDSNIPLPVMNTGVLLGKTILSVTTGAAHSLAVCSDGFVAAWGYGGHGSLGNGSLADSTVPVLVDQTGVLMCDKVIAIAAGEDHNVALTDEGHVVSWGNYCLGNGTIGLSSVPVAVTQSGPLANRSVVAVAAGAYHSLALCSDGRVVSWGWNAHGQLGDGTTNDRPVPVLVGGALANKIVIGIAGGELHSLAVCSDGTVYAWGDGTYGQLGIGSYGSTSIPVQVTQSGPFATKLVTAVSAGQDQSLALCSDGTMFAWGANTYGQLGNLSNVPSPSAVQSSTNIPFTGKTITSISALARSGIAQASDGTVGNWGFGGLGAIGNGSNNNANQAVNFSALAPGERYVKAKAGSQAWHGAALVATVTPVAGTVDPLNLNIVGTSVTSVVPQPDGKHIIIGLFTSVGGVPRNNIARLNADGTVDLGFNPNPNGAVNVCAVEASGNILIGGGFNTIGGTPRQYLARLDPSGALLPFNPAPNGIPQCITVQRTGHFIVGGRFNVIATQPRSFLAQFDVTGALTSFSPSFNDWVDTMAEEANGDLLIGGRFTSPKNYLCRLSSAGVVQATFSPNPNAAVFTVAVQPSGQILVGGDFTTIAGGSTGNRVRAARLLLNGTLETGFDPQLSASGNGWPLSFTTQTDGKILVSGWFTTSSSTPRNRVARYLPSGALETSFDPSANSIVSNVYVQPDGKIWLSGQFSSLNPNGGATVSRNLLARLYNDPAQQILSVPNTSLINWTRTGAGPEIEQVTFEYSINNSPTWSTVVGPITRVPGTGWTCVPSTFLPSNAMLRARGRPMGHYENGSSGLIEQMICYNAPPPPPDIAVGVAGIDIESCTSAMPTPPISFGSQVVHTGNTMTFTVCNQGLTPLVLGALTLAPTSDFTLSGYTPGTLNAGQCRTFDVTFNPTMMGVRNATVTIASNDPDEATFCFNVTGSGVCPEINVDYPWGTHLTDGSSGVSIGTGVPTCTCVTQTFWITNLGTSDLHLVGAYIDGLNQSDFSVSQPTPATVTNPNGVSSVTVTFCPTTFGTKGATLHILSDDGDESSFDIALSGKAVGPEINVQQTAPAIATMQDNCTLDLGYTLLGSALSANFKVTNIGNPTLFVSSVVASPTPVFDVTSFVNIPGATPATGGLFRLNFTPTALGTYTGTVTILNNDCDEGHFVINVIGHCVASMNPVFTSILPTNRIVYVGSSVSFSSPITVPSTAQVKWWRNSTAVSTTNLTSSATTTSYNIPSAALTDGGIYHATATPPTTPPPTTTSNAVLTVVSPTTQIISKTVGSSVTMTIQATSGGTMSYVWCKDGQQISSQPNGPSLTLTGLTTADSGFYECKVTGPGGGMLPAGPIILNVGGGYVVPPTTVGKYIGIVDRGPMNKDLGGRIDLQIFPTGLCSGAIRIGASPTSYTFSGGLNGVGYCIAQVPAIGTTIAFKVGALAPNYFQGGGLSQVSNSIGTSNFSGWRHVWSTANTTTTSTANYAGAYTMALHQSNTSPTLPQGYGFGSFSVSSTGTYSLSGETATGDLFTTNAFMGPAGEIAVYHYFPAGTGSSLVGISQIVLNNAANITDNSIGGGNVTWSRAASLSTTLYPAGFASIPLNAFGGYYSNTPQAITGSKTLFFLYAPTPPSQYSPDRTFNIGVPLSYSQTIAPTLPTTLTFSGSGTLSRAFFTGKFELIDTNPIAPCAPLIHRTPRSTSNVQPNYRGITVKFLGSAYVGAGYYLIDQLPATANTTVPKVTLSGAAVLQ